MKLSTILSFGLTGSATLATGHIISFRHSNWTIGQTVQTHSSSVVGHAAPNATEVSEYLGIPYAQPPIGNLRFAAPLSYNGNNTIYGSAFGPACLAVQQTGSGDTSNPANLTAAGFQTVADGAEAGVKMSEDCLTLNIWTKPQVGESKKAVMIWIYGGAFTSGDSGNPLYNGQFIADQEDVVIVSINYRVTIFGFPGGSAGDHNVGLLDQRLAVEWVRDNIAAFGGDPNRIILFGQSAGAASIDFYTYAWASDPIVTGFIEESGTTMVIPPLNTTFSEAIWSNISSKVGCASGDASAVLSCMRDANASSILAAIGSNKIAPTVDSSIVFNESEYTARSLAGNFIKKPLLLGNNDNENGIFRVGAILHNQPEPQAYWDKDNLQQFACPCAARGNVSVYNSVPTWRYHWFGVFPNTNLTTYPDSGAYHGSEIPIIFNTSPAGNGILPNTARELEVMNYTRGAWVAFAKDPVNGPKAYGWPEYDPTKATLVRLGLNDSASPDFALPQVYDAPCGTMFAVSSAGANGTNAGNSSAKVSGGDATVDRASWWTLMVVFSTLASFAILL